MHDGTVMIDQCTILCDHCTVLYRAKLLSGLSHMRMVG